MVRRCYFSGCLSSVGVHLATTDRLSRPLWGWGIACAILAMVGLPDLFAAEQFPYQATIGTGSAYVRSGPGQRHYPTQILKPGEPLEVYRYDEGGWCAVRPPEGSFSWIASHDVQRLSEQHGEIAVKYCTVRVGSDVSPARSAVQVLLHQGNQVKILPSGPHDDPRWLRISPPAGEFRWVALSDLAPQGSTQPSEVALTSGWTSQTESDSTVNDEPTHVGMPEYPEDHTKNDPNAVQIIKGSPAEDQLKPFATHHPGFAPPQPLNSAINVPAGNAPTPVSFGPVQLPSVPEDSQLPGSSPLPFSTNTANHSMPEHPRPHASDIAELELRLSQIVVRPKEEWNFAELQQQIQARWEGSDSVSERQQLGALLERIASFQGVKNVDFNILPTPGVSPPIVTTPHLSEANELTGDAAPFRQLAIEDRDTHDPFDRGSESPNTPIYDAVGKLKPVVSRKNSAPPYALLDEHGEVISFVTPAPDLNLQPYVGRRIGVHGTRGFMQEYRKAHVVAGRATPIHR